MRPKLLPLIGIALCASGASAQNPLYETAFDDAVGWTLDGCWAVDGTPAVGGGIAHSGTTSLNMAIPSGYDFCEDDGAMSPQIDLGQGVAGTQVTFWCNWNTLEDLCDYDTRHLRVWDAAQTTMLLDLCFQGGTTCGAAETWHQHTIPLDPAFGKVHLEFWFDVNDVLFNGGWGWAVDDVEVSGDCGLPEAYCTAKVNSQGCTPTIFTTGVPSFSGTGNAFRVQAQNVLNKHPGLMIFSFAEGSAPFGGGTLCLGGSVKRTQGQASGGNPPPTDCSGAFSFNITPAIMAIEGMTPGTDVFVQYWSRDTGFSAPNNMGLTAGMKFTVCN